MFKLGDNMRTIKKYKTQYINKYPDGKTSKGEIRNRVLFFDGKVMVADIWLNDDEVTNSQLTLPALSTKLQEIGSYLTLEELDSYKTIEWEENQEERQLGYGGYDK